MKKYPFSMVYMTDHIVDNKEYNIERKDAEGNSREVAYSIRDTLGQLCKSVTMFEDIKSFVLQLPNLKDHVMLSTRYGFASPNSKALVPAICESNEIRFIGADSYTHMLCNDKYLSKKYIEEFGLRSALGVLIRDVSNHTQLNAISFLKFPVVIKPNYGGGSNGITKENIQYTLEGAYSFVKKLQKYQQQPILVEEYIPGYEVEVILFGNNKRMLFLDEVQILIKGQDYFTDLIYDLQTKKIDDDASSMVYSNLLNRKDRAAMIKLFQSFSKVEFMRIDCRIYNGHAYILELSPDCYLGEHCGVHRAFERRGFNFTDMFNLMIQNSLYPDTLIKL